jgi:Flp pilus assembly pilin Flp
MLSFGLIKKDTKNITQKYLYLIQGEVAIMKMISVLFRDERGQSLAEYGLIICILSVAVMLVMMNIGRKNNDTLNQVANEMVS